MWRNFDDIRRSWASIRTVIDYYDHHQDKHIPAQGPGRWHDPDMVYSLEICHKFYYSKVDSFSQYKNKQFSVVIVKCCYYLEAKIGYKYFPSSSIGNMRFS